MTLSEEMKAELLKYEYFTVCNKLFKLLNDYNRGKISNKEEIEFIKQNKKIWGHQNHWTYL